MKLLMKGNELKFKDLIDTLELGITCPPEDCENLDLKAYRWVRSPIDETLDFLPNHLYGEAMKIPPRKNMNSEEKCSRCAISLFTNEEAASGTFKNLPPSIQSKIGYTHIAVGLIEKSDGLVGHIAPNGHLSFYEYTSAVLCTKFTVKSSLL